MTVTLSPVVGAAVVAVLGDPLDESVGAGSAGLVVCAGLVGSVVAGVVGASDGTVVAEGVGVVRLELGSGSTGAEEGVGCSAVSFTGVAGCTSIGAPGTAVHPSPSTTEALVGSGRAPVCSGFASVVSA